MIKAIFREEVSRSGIGVWIIDEKPNGDIFVAKPSSLQMEEKGQGAFALPEPTFSIRREDVQPLFQSILNELVRLGIRADSDRTAGELDASKKNLEDLRSITSKLLSVLEGRKHE